METRRAEAIGNTLQSLLNALGRDDVGVGDVTEEGGTIHFTLAKGKFTHADHISSALLDDRQELLRQLNAILSKLSTQVERAHIAQAG